MRPSLVVNLTGQLLIAMPGMPDPRFARAVVVICSHDEQGAMGLVINRLFGALDFPALLEQLGIVDSTANPLANRPALRVHFGGPVETGRGFVLHSDDYHSEHTVPIGTGYALTASLEILRDLANGQGPAQGLLALGYAGWAPGQLEAEIQQNGWLTAPADAALLFDQALDNKWERALAKLGIKPAMLASDAGHA